MKNGMLKIKYKKTQIKKKMVFNVHKGGNPSIVIGDYKFTYLGKIKILIYPNCVYLKSTKISNPDPKFEKKFGVYFSNSELKTNSLLSDL